MSIIKINLIVILLTGCKLDNGTCIAGSTNITDPDSCTNYHCHIDDTIPWNVTVTLETTKGIRIFI